MQAHMIPRLLSITVHMEEPILVQGVSRWEVATSRVVMRSVEVTQTLYIITNVSFPPTLHKYGKRKRVKSNRSETHNIPTVNTPQTAILLLVGSLSLLMTGIGKAIMTRSLMMLNAAFANQNAVMFIHVPPPGIFLLKANSTGVHWKMLEKTVPVVNAITIAIHTQQVIINQGRIKTLM